MTIILFFITIGYCQDLTTNQKYFLNKIYEPYEERGKLTTDSSFYTCNFQGDTLIVSINVFKAEDKLKQVSISGDDIYGYLNNDMTFLILSGLKADGAYILGISPFGGNADAFSYENGQRAIDEDFNWQGLSIPQKNCWVTKYIVPLSNFNLHDGCELKLNILNVSHENKTRIFSSNLPLKDRIFSYSESNKILLAQNLQISNNLLQLNIEPYINYSKSNKDDLTYGGSSEIILDKTKHLCGTFNPDLSLVDADIKSFNLSSAPENLPEKRVFFSQNSSILQSPLNLIYTRNFNDLRYGLKYTTSEDDFSTNIIYLDDKIENQAVFGQMFYHFNKNLKTGILGAYGKQSEQSLTSFYADYSFDNYNGKIKYQQAALSVNDTIKQAFYLMASYGNDIQFINLDFTRIKLGFMPFCSSYWQSGYDELHAETYYQWPNASYLSGLIWDTHLTVQTQPENSDEIIYSSFNSSFTKYFNQKQYTLGVDFNNDNYFDQKFENRLAYLSASFSPSEKYNFDFLIKSGKNFNNDLIYTKYGSNFPINKYLKGYLSHSVKAIRESNTKNYIGENYKIYNIATVGIESYWQELNLKYFCQYSELDKELQNNFLVNYTYQNLKCYIVYNLNTIIKTEEAISLKFSYNFSYNPL